ncbi:MAG: hypothetical protein CML66_15560 [Rhodobacteraceae bacterium]|nr:hypothetical protein [Paracoccaceae bacterium]MAY44549.1 hypothetical protein [Paracoccaceae bacterium]
MINTEGTQIMTFDTQSFAPAVRLGAAAIALVLVAACDDLDTMDMSSASGTASPTPVSATAQQPDSIVGTWEMFPAIGPSTKGCSIEFMSSALSATKGRVSPFACHTVEGLGGVNGIARINGWERKGRTIILSGIADSNIGTIDLPVNSFTDRISGVTRDDIRFTMVRK